MTLLKRISAASRMLFRGFEEWDDEKWIEYTQGPITKAGVRINETSALTISSVYSGLNTIAGTIASLPRRIYRRLPNSGKAVATDHPLYDRLHVRPNEWMTAWNWFYASIFHKYLWGNWYTYIAGNSYRNREFLPLLPDRTYRDPADREFVITQIGKKTYRIPMRKILHIPHITLDGITGKGVIHYARESLGIAKGLDAFAGSFFGNGVHAGGIVEQENKVGENERKALMADFNNKYRGLGNSFGSVWLPKGVKWHPEEVNAEKAQALESRQFSVIEVARWLGVPPHILKDLARATFSNIEHQSTELVVYCFMSLATQIEQAMDLAFFDSEERQEYYTKIELKGLLRGDLKARTEFYTAMVDRGIYNADEVRALEDENPQKDGLGAVYLVPFNMQNKQLVISGDQDDGQVQASERNVTPQKRMISSPPEYRTTMVRRKITQGYMQRFIEYGEAITAEEVEAVRKALSDTLTAKSETDFSAWIESFYREFEQTVATRATALVTTYAETISPVAQDEIGSDADISSTYSQFQIEYIGALALRHVGSSVGQLKKIVSEREDGGPPLAELIETRLSEWEEKRSEKIRMHESIRAESAFSRAAYGACGVSKITSISYGKSCPYCNALHGKVIGITEAFLQAGDFQPEGADEPLKVTSKKQHPPYHGGCDCGIGASY